MQRRILALGTRQRHLPGCGPRAATEIGHQSRNAWIPNQSRT
jgi:hypothetical protein